MAPIKSKLTPEQRVQMLANSAALHDEYEAEQAREAEQAQARAAREAQELASRREAVRVELTKGGPLAYDNNHEKASPVVAEAGRVFAVEAVDWDGWTVRENGQKLFIPWSDARPCAAETKNDRNDSDALACADEAEPALNIPPANTPAVEAPEPPRTAENNAPVSKVTQSQSAAQAASRGPEEVERGDWYRTKRNAVRRVAVAAGVGGIALAVLEEMTDPCMPEGWPLVTGGVESLMSALDLGKYQVLNALRSLKDKRILKPCDGTPAHTNVAQVYEFLPELNLPTIKRG